MWKPMAVRYAACAENDRTLNVKEGGGAKEKWLVVDDLQRKQ